MIIARCAKCGGMWGISINHKIGKRGYLCPYCDKRKAPSRLASEKAQAKILNHSVTDIGGIVNVR